MYHLEYDTWTDTWYAWCEECHNPDGDGVGRADRTAFDLDEAIEWCHEHDLEAHAEGEWF